MDAKSIVIFDWDDTLYPTSFMHQTGSLSYDNLSVLDDHISKLLTKCLQTADIVFIITNAAKAWIDVTMAELPKTKAISNRINIISARDRWVNSNIDMGVWKTHTFRQEYLILRTKYNKLNIISVGDAEYEYNALVNLHRKDNRDILKSIKFKGEPTFDELCEELVLTFKILDQAISINKHLDWNFN